MATIRDVAREAEVSIATVSRVFNGNARVNEETRRRVTAAAARLDYWPNGAARSLTTNRTHALGVLLPDLFGEFFSEVIRGIDHAARRERLQTLVSSSHADSDELVAAARSMRGRIDGLIVMAPDTGSVGAIRQITRKFPVVLLNPRFEVEGCGVVAIANLEGAHAVVDHLLGLGHRRVAILKGPPGNVDAEERLRGYRKAIREAGLRPNAALEFQGDFTEASGYAAATRLLVLEPRPTAIFASNDYMAIGLLSALRDAGVEVPGGMAVAGFDDIAISQYLSPPLTTVRVDAYELGERAVRLWIAAGKSAEARAGRPSIARGGKELLPATLVVRASCGSTTHAPLELRTRRRWEARLLDEEDDGEHERADSTPVHFPLEGSK